MSSSFPGLLQALNQQAATVANETELRQAWIFVLQNHLGINFQAERGRRDSSYNNVVIEFKDKGLFRSSDTSPAFREAINDRLLP